MSFPCSDDSWKSGDVVSDKFPVGLRVLVVDDDPTCLRILEMMLKNCHYEVTKCNQAEAALKLLRENKDGFDIVLSDVYMPDMDGFTLLERIGLEMDLPVIMMSADDRHNVVMNGVKHGACDYLIKPVRMEALKNIWQHVVRRKKKEEWVMVEKESDKSVGEGEQYQILKEVLDDSSSGNREDSVKKRENEEDENGNSSSIKKPRVVWSVDLHGKFVRAVNELGIDKAVPKKILEKMDERGLTRENVASHLQKYRIYLRKLSKKQQNDFLNNNSFMRPPGGSSSYGSKFPSSAPHMPFRSFDSIRSSNNNLQVGQTQSMLSLEKLRSRLSNQPAHQFGGNVNAHHMSPLTAQNNSALPLIVQQPQPHYMNQILNEASHKQHVLSQEIPSNAAAFGQYPNAGPQLARPVAYAEPSGPPTRFQDSHGSIGNNFQSLASNSNMLHEQGQFNADAFVRDFVKFEDSQQAMNSGQTVDDDLSKFKAIIDAQHAADIGSEYCFFENFGHDDLVRLVVPPEAPGSVENYL